MTILLKLASHQISQLLHGNSYDKSAVWRGVRNDAALDTNIALSVNIESPHDVNYGYVRVAKVDGERVSVEARDYIELDSDGHFTGYVGARVAEEQLIGERPELAYVSAASIPNKHTEVAPPGAALDAYEALYTAPAPSRSEVLVLSVDQLIRLIDRYGHEFAGSMSQDDASLPKFNGDFAFDPASGTAYLRV